jgi:hypothetical protein
MRLLGKLGYAGKVDAQLGLLEMIRELRKA